MPNRTVSLCVERGTEAGSPNPLRRKSWFSGLLDACGKSWFTGLLRGRLPWRGCSPSCAGAPARAYSCAGARLRQTERDTRAALADMDRAVAEVDTEGFFRASRQAVRIQLAGRFNLVADAIAADDAREYLSEPGLPEVLEVADCIIYSGQALPQEDLAAWRDRVVIDISALNKLVE